MENRLNFGNVGRPEKGKEIKTFPINWRVNEEEKNFLVKVRKIYLSNLRKKIVDFVSKITGDK